MAVEPELVGRAEEIALIAATPARGRRHTVQIISTGGVESEANMTDNAPTTVVLIHGLWMTALSWEHWVERYEARGFEVIARSWPGMDADVETLRRDTSGFDDLGIEDIVDHYAKIVGELDAPPIIIRCC